MVGREIPELSPDGQTLLTDFTSGVRRPLRLWDTATGEPRCGPIELPAGRGQPGLDRRRETPVPRDAGKTIRVVDVASGKVVRTFPIDAEEPVCYRIARSVPMRNGAPTLDQVARSRCGMPRPAPYSARSGDSKACSGALVFSPDGSRLLGADEYGALKIWDIATGREIAATKLTGVLIQVARFSADGKRLAVAGVLGQLLTGEVRILDAETAREVWSLKGHTRTGGRRGIQPGRTTAWLPPASTARSDSGT